jgi:hypothetical protein
MTNKKLIQNRHKKAFSIGIDFMTGGSYPVSCSDLAPG